MSEKDFWDSVRARQAAGETVDFHTARAAWEAGIPESEVTPEQRTAAKQMNFYKLYGPPDRLHDEYATVDEAFYEEMKALALKYNTKITVSSPTGRSFSAQAAAANLLLGCMPKALADQYKLIARDEERKKRDELLCGMGDFSELETRILKGRGGWATGELTTFVASARCRPPLFVLDSLGWMDAVPAKAQADDGVKVGRDGKPVKPEPYFRREAKRGKKRF